jgi:hypothetical protein
MNRVNPDTYKDGREEDLMPIIFRRSKFENLVDMI